MLSMLPQSPGPANWILILAYQRDQSDRKTLLSNYARLISGPLFCFEQLLLQQPNSRHHTRCITTILFVRMLAETVGLDKGQRHVLHEHVWSSFSDLTDLSGEIVGTLLQHLYTLVGFGAEYASRERHVFRIIVDARKVRL